MQRTPDEGASPESDRDERSLRGPAPVGPGASPAPVECGGISRPGKGRADNLTPLCLAPIGRGAPDGFAGRPGLLGGALDPVREPRSLGGHGFSRAVSALKSKRL